MATIEYPLGKNQRRRPPNLYLIGPQCTGKTTLLNALKAHYSIDVNRALGDDHIEQPAIVEEIVRVVMHERGFCARDLRNSTRGLQLQMRILLGQNDAEEKIEAQWYISDRSGLDALVYAKAYVGIDTVTILESTREWAKSRSRMQDAVVIFCEAGNADWLSADAVRLEYNDVAEWEGLNEAFHAMLRQYDIKYTVLPWHVRDLQERVALISNILGTNE